MAYAVVCSLVQTIAHIQKHDGFPISVAGKQQIESLNEQALFLKRFLEKSSSHDEDLDTKIRDAADQAEDLLEHFMYEDIRSQLKSERSAAIGREIKPSNHLYDIGELRFAMEAINAAVEEAALILAENLKLTDTTPLRYEPSSSSSTPAPLVEEVTVGLDEDSKKIKNLVCGESNKRQIIPITGMGGIGKTTLAKNVYHDQLIVEEFSVRAWVTVTQDYKPENIFANLLYALQRVVGEGTVDGKDSAEDQVYKILTVRKYLIVLDDLWSEKAWDEIRKVFPDSNNGSRIMITTRIDSVASHADASSPLHKMHFMDLEKSWDLLRQKVFAMRECPNPLEKIGKEIAVSCGGLPLAIVLVAGILSSVNETPVSWDKIAKEVHSAVDKEEGEFDKIISLSYTHLPLYLRPCFLYMGGFPEDYEMRVSKLIRLWIAEGFVKDEEEAVKCLGNLVTRSLALVKTTKSNGGVKSCNVHDLVRDLCKRASREENYERRLSIASPNLTRHVRFCALTLRSVLSFQPNESMLASFRKFMLLRVLDVVDTDAYSLPSAVFELFHLRYLGFGCPMEVPSAIARLRNLRALIVRPSKRLRKHSNDELYLPLEIWTMPLLTHLVSFFDLMPNPKEAATALENLLTLTVVKKLICTEEMMKMIPNVKKLGITYFGDKYQEDYQLHNLNLLSQLEKLTLVLRKGPHVGITANPTFPQALRKLTLSGWRLPWEVMGTIGSLPDLQVLKLRDHACEGGKWETDDEQFRTLEYLHIDESDLEEWVTDGSHFPKLKRLEIYRCLSLTEIPSEMGDASALELIGVDYANDPLMQSVKKFQEDQKGDGNMSLQTSFVYYNGF